ncbi:MAG: CoA-binding protein [DPANN group archaeon]|nr:CoA-binding protein [DPANN group archaeon]
MNKIQMINKDYIYALVGASADQNKYGFKILKNMTDAGFKITPVNPKSQDILNLKTYKSITDIKEKIDVVIFVVPPNITENILKQVHTTKINNVWFQPGSENETTLKYCKKNKINYVNNLCIMVEK